MPQKLDAVHLTRAYVEKCLRHLPDPTLEVAPKTTAGVLFLIHRPPDPSREPRLLLNKRSTRVKQPGDLCCPGGRVHQGMDHILSWALRTPLSPLVHSPGWRAGRDQSRRWKRLVGLYWACCVRESWEEIGLSPLRTTFLGLLPCYRLRLFNRHILPMAGWMTGAAHFRPNWEVEKILPIPFSNLLNPDNYGVYVLDAGEVHTTWDRQIEAFPCFLHRDEQGEETLWGATYHIVVRFLETVFDFKPPSMDERPVVTGILDRNYLTGEPGIPE